MHLVFMMLYNSKYFLNECLKECVRKHKQILYLRLLHSEEISKENVQSVGTFVSP